MTRALLLLMLLVGCRGIANVDDKKLEPVEAGSGGSTEAGPTCDESALQTDAKNCGKCGHDCLGGVCTAGRCGPIEYTDSVGAHVRIAVDETNVYWLTVGEKAQPKLIDTLAKDLTGYRSIATAIYRPIDFRIDESEVHWVEYDIAPPPGGVHAWHIKKTIDPRAPQPQKQWPGNYTSLTAIEVTSDAIFVAQADSSGSSGSLIDRIPRDGSPTLTLLERSQPPSGVFALAVDSEFLYYADREFGEVGRIPRQGGDVQVIDHSTQPSAIALDQDELFFVGETAILRKPKGGPTDAPADVVGQLPHPNTDKPILSLAVDAEFVYFAQADPIELASGVVARLPRGGVNQTAEKVLEGLEPPLSLAIDGQAVYVAAHSKILRVAK